MFIDSSTFAGGEMVNNRPSASERSTSPLLDMDSMVVAAREETLWVYTDYPSTLFCFYRSEILSINRRAEPAHVYPTAAKLTIKSLIMSIEFILIATV